MQELYSISEYYTYQTSAVQLEIFLFFSGLEMVCDLQVAGYDFKTAPTSHSHSDTSLASHVIIVHTWHM